MVRRDCPPWYLPFIVCARPFMERGSVFSHGSSRRSHFLYGSVSDHRGHARTNGTRWPLSRCDSPKERDLRSRDGCGLAEETGCCHVPLSERCAARIALRRRRGVPEAGEPTGSRPKGSMPTTSSPAIKAMVSTCGDPARVADAVGIRAGLAEETGPRFSERLIF